MIPGIQKKMMIKKLTEFVKECDNDEALTYFLSQVLGAERAHSVIDEERHEKTVQVIFEDKILKYEPQELIEELFSDESRVDTIRTTVHYIKDQMDYKKRINTLV